MNKIFLAKQKEYNVEKIKINIIKGLNELDLSKNFISKGDKVLIKPNMAIGKHYSHHICTHPAVIKAVCDIISDFGGKVIVGDSPGFGSFVSNAKKSGYMEFLNGYNLVDFDEKVQINCLENKIFKHFNIAKQVLESDKIINIAKFKTHGSMLLTLSVKNMFGSVVGMEKAEYHLKCGKDIDMFASYLVELYYSLKPVLNIIDAITGMEGNGPVSGTPRNLGYLAIGTEGTILDCVCAETIGFDRNNLPTYRSAVRLGYINENSFPAQTIGPKPEELFIKDYNFIVQPNMRYSRLIKFLSKLLPVKPKVIKTNCVLCKVCINICPVKTIKKGVKHVIINYSKCIQCFCCQEFCEYNAILPQKPVLRKIFSFLINLFTFKLHSKKVNKKEVE